MAVDLTLLVPEFKSTLDQLFVNCQAQGVEMRAYFGLRDPFQQAKLWRQSRSMEEITQMTERLQSDGANFLAHCITSIGPQNGKWVTNAIPGYSWHQWGEAVDCCWVVNGTIEWSTQKRVNGLNGYHVYADCAEALSLTAGGHWNKLKDWGHIQLRSASGPQDLFTRREIDAAMQKRFGDHSLPENP